MNINETVRKQIVQELKINQLTLHQCPYIVKCYHSFYHNGIISIVLEYMDRGSLADIIKQTKQIPEPYLAVISNQVSLLPSALLLCRRIAVLISPNFTLQATERSVLEFSCTFVQN